MTVRPGDPDRTVTFEERTALFVVGCRFRPDVVNTFSRGPLMSYPRHQRPAETEPEWEPRLH